MKQIERKIAAFIRKHELLQKGDQVLVAVSGGPDSLALLHFLQKNKLLYEIEVAAIHVDHMLRGEASYQDLLFVQQFCQNHEMECHTARINIKEKMITDQKGMQETARKYRYTYFQKVMAKHAYNKLAMGHHGDDQIETILMGLTRGSGSGRNGIPVSRKFSPGKIVRPFLCLTKKEIENYCRNYQLQPRRDASNDTQDYTRNRFRHHVLPFLKKENGRVHEHFQRFSEEMIEDETYLYALAAKKMEQLHVKNKGEISLDITKFLQMPLSLQRRGIHLILNYLYNDIPGALMKSHLDAIQDLLESKHPSGQLDLPAGLRVQRSYQSCLFSFKDVIDNTAYYIEINENEQIFLPNGYTIRFEKQTTSPSHPILQSHMIQLCPEDVTLPLIVRTRQAGDRIAIKGLNGTKKIKDIFIDEKIPLSERKNWPVVTDQSGEIIWLPGLKKSIFDTYGTQLPVYYVLQYSKDF
ncbi:tRNA lysidine(34) synthetase TilS [Bacillus chungangensis]|uniref:tRNA(Ile)-lysidine synthase n=1 Tax=Bacillus chungangensis TaxID=587633 RepID=A0ABT9WXP6_9BACI|nr:tRNA lysidine(34) synthetase TilS [Bacillus chungangensis]MDQ0177888.1 tRNA(Ile)-lysidine synthetase-like protein [Bacillus chungangensis]